MWYLRTGRVIPLCSHVRVGRVDCSWGSPPGHLCAASLGCMAHSGICGMTGAVGVRYRWIQLWLAPVLTSVSVLELWSRWADIPFGVPMEEFIPPILRGAGVQDRTHAAQHTKALML